METQLSIGSPVVVLLACGITTLLVMGIIFFLVNSNKYKKSIVSLDRDELAVESVARLRKSYNLENDAKTYELAIRVLTRVTEQQALGVPVGSRSADPGFQRLEMPKVDREIWFNALEKRTQ